jgi:hypothetical protein
MTISAFGTQKFVEGLFGAAVALFYMMPLVACFALRTRRSNKIHSGPFKHLCDGYSDYWEVFLGCVGIAVTVLEAVAVFFYVRNQFISDTNTHRALAVGIFILLDSLFHFGAHIACWACCARKQKDESRASKRTRSLVLGVLTVVLYALCVGACVAVAAVSSFWKGGSEPTRILVISAFSICAGWCTFKAIIHSVIVYRRYGSHSRKMGDASAPLVRSEYGSPYGVGTRVDSRRRK